MQQNLMAFSILVASLFQLVPGVYGQANETAADSIFSALVERARSEIRQYEQADQSAKADSAERAYAQEFFQFYLDYPDSEASSRAAHNAFSMWGNTGAALEVEEALAHIGTDSRVWSLAFLGIANAYRRSDEKTEADYVDLLQRLRGTLTHPRSKSTLQIKLADHYMLSGQKQRAAELYREVVNLNADSIIVRMALGNLHEMESLNVGQEAPPFEATTVSGETVALSELRGDVVLLEFWATWCAPCIPEIPYLENVWSKYRGDGFHLVGISLDERTETLKEFVEAEDIMWPQVQQADGWDGEIVKLYNVGGIPRMYLIDRNGTIAAKDLRKEEIEREVRGLMEGSQE